MNYLVADFVAGLASAAISDYRFSNELESNKVEGYHCQPIQKVQALEEAKALIDGYHAKAMVRG